MANSMRHHIAPGLLIARTCHRCMVFKMADAFVMMKDSRYLLPRYRAMCQVCVYKETNKINGRSQESSQATATMKYEPWTDSALAMVDRLTREGRSNSEIAILMNRTFRSIQNIKFKERILRTRPYTATPKKPLNLELLRSIIKEVDLV